MESLEIQIKFGEKNSFYSYFIHNRDRELNIQFLYKIKKPKKIITWFTTNPEIAEFASRCGLTVTCKSIKNRIVK